MTLKAKTTRTRFEAGNRKERRKMKKTGENKAFQAAKGAMTFIWFILLIITIAGMFGSVYGGIDVLLHDGVNSRWWLGVIGFFVFRTLVKKFAEKMKK